MPRSDQCGVHSGTAYTHLCKAALRITRACCSLLAALASEVTCGLQPPQSRELVVEHEVTPASWRVTKSSAGEDTAPRCSPECPRRLLGGRQRLPPPRGSLSVWQKWHTPGHGARAPRARPRRRQRIRTPGSGSWARGTSCIARRERCQMPRKHLAKRSWPLLLFPVHIGKPAADQGFHRPYRGTRISQHGLAELL